MHLQNLCAQFQFQSFDEDIGYSSHSFHIIQDDFGFLWSATLTGLVKTDGYSYTKFTTSRADTNTIATNFSTYLFEDKFSNIWVNNYLYGLSIYDRKKDHFIRLPSNKNNNQVSDYITNFCELNDSTIFFSGNKGLHQVTFKEESYESLSIQNYRLPDSVKHFEKDIDHIWHINPISENLLLLSSVMGFYIFDTKNKEFLHYKSVPWLPLGKGFSTWYDLDRKELWFAISNEEITIVNMEDKMSRKVPGLLLQGGESYFSPLNDEILLLKENGGRLHAINRISNKIDSYTAGSNSKIGLMDRWARRFTKTRDGTIFIASSDVSRFQHIPSRKKKVDHLQILDRSDHSTTCIYEDKDFFLASFEAHGFYIKNKQNGVENHLDKENSFLSDNLVMHIDRLKDGRFLILAKTYAYIFDPFTYSSEILSKAIFFRNGIELSNGDLWLFPGGGQPAQLFQKTQETTYAKKKVQNDFQKITNVRGAIENKDGSIWLISSNDGLFKINPDYSVDKQWRADPRILHSIVGNSLESIFLDSKNRLWLGSLEGLSLFDQTNDSFMNFTRNEGLDDTSISDIIEDCQGQIWISSFDGLYTFNEDNHQLIRIDPSMTINQHFSQRGMFRYDSVIYATGKQGIDILTCLAIKENQIPPEIQLVNIINDQQPIYSERNLETMDKIVITHENRRAKMQFSAIHYGSQNGKKIQYRFDEESWRTTSSRYIDLSEASYGNQILEVKAGNIDGYWSEIKSYEIKINRPWYLAWWFHLILFLLTISTFYLLYKWKLGQELKIQKQQLDIDKQIAEIELKALKAQMNPHFVFNSLNSVKALILEQKSDEAITYLTSFSNLIRKILNNSNDKFIRLQDELQTVKLYLELESLRFDEAFSYSIEVDPQVSVDFVEIPALLLQPFIENAIWHGLLPKSMGDKRLKIHIEKVGEFIDISIEDNGIGRKAAQLIKTRSRSKNTSLGMTINNQRIQLLKQLYGNEASVDIIDLKDESNQAQGTKIVIRFKDQS
ncbi:histidine kinase [Saprospiraceae bacterium]|nr:histidine kinase [Saprospiraceae bacterium]